MARKKKGSYHSDSHRKYSLKAHIIFVVKYQKKLLVDLGEDIVKTVSTIKEMRTAARDSYSQIESELKDMQTGLINTISNNNALDNRLSTNEKISLDW